MATQRLTKALLDGLRSGQDRTIFDEAMPRFAVRVRASGKRVFLVQYRTPAGQTRKITLGEYAADARGAGHTLDAARRWARGMLGRIDNGDDPAAERDQQRQAEATKTVAEVIEQFEKRYLHAAGSDHRSAKEYESAFNRLVKPAIGKLGIYDLRRSRVAEMFDHIEDNHGPVMADRTLAYLRKAFNWYAARDDRFVPPIVKGMARTKPKERARDRVLSDDEIRAIWPHLKGTWGAFVKTLLLTAQRRSEVAEMGRSEIADGVWTIPADRYKTKRANVVPLSEAALAIIAEQPKIGRSDYVFASSTGGALSEGGKPKATLDAALAKEGADLPHWTLHDLRRTAKTLMMRAGVRPDISERVLGHVIAGVEGVYDRHDYIAEKRDALERLAAEIGRILDPAPDNVVTLSRRPALRRASSASAP